MKKEHTIKDIAKALGVSIGTVDRALNNRGRISKETRKKVLEMADKIGYKPNRIARTLVLQRNIRIAAILPTIPEYFFGKIEDGIKNAARELKDFGIEVVYYYSKAVNEFLPQIELFKNVIQTKYDGILIIPTNANLLKPYVDAAVEALTPVVTLNNDVPQSKRLCFVGEDSIKAGKTAAELMGKFLNNEGKVAILSGFLQATALKRRYEGFEEVIHQNYPGIELIGPYEYSEDMCEAYEITKELLLKNIDLKGIFLTSTTGLVPAANAILDSKREKFVKIIGFDINEQIQVMMREDIIYSTIYQDPYAQGYYSLRILSKYIIDGLEPQQEYLYTKSEILLKENSNNEAYPLYMY